SVGQALIDLDHAVLLADENTAVRRELQDRRVGQPAQHHRVTEPGGQRRCRSAGRPGLRDEGGTRHHRRRNDQPTPTYGTPDTSHVAPRQPAAYRKVTADIDTSPGHTVRSVKESSSRGKSESSACLSQDAGYRRRTPGAAADEPRSAPLTSPSNGGSANAARAICPPSRSSERPASSRGDCAMGRLPGHTDTGGHGGGPRVSPHVGA